MRWIYGVKKGLMLLAGSKEQRHLEKKKKRMDRSGRMLYILDSYAWVEYFTGTEKGRKVKALFENPKNRFITIECCIAELMGWSIKNNIDFHCVLKTIEANSDISPVLRDEWIDAAVIKSEMLKNVKDFGLIDAILIAKQRRLNSRIVTADLHFKGLRDIEFI